MKVLSVVGARPQFIKAAMVSRAIREHDARGGPERIEEVLVHTGQHYDAEMSSVFFDELGLERPGHNLEIAALSHGAMTGRMMEAIEALTKAIRPDWVLVYGDTNSTLAGALAAAKVPVPVAHVEAGLRSHNLSMPEEINRVLTDRVASLLLCPTPTAVENLAREGYPFGTPTGDSQQIKWVGDVMYDAVLHYRSLARARIDLARWSLRDGAYALCTLHRQENTDDPVRLAAILRALATVARNITVIIPMHPRTKKAASSFLRTQETTRLKVVAPVSYLEMQRLEMGARVIITDSGGIQKEACFHGVPCITTRDETEWAETVQAGCNQIVGADTEKIVQAVLRAQASAGQVERVYGDGQAAVRICEALLAARA